ncbi:maleylpyruvate isomerase family mycothiol-dependent enzyme [Dactylosporangium sp. NPDC006015]|uniref:maleylpyruvate isomerase family mycothiol-dependent enzyme n=1 Tax=Dactylosporangium sp. NPDC006015 TaxID=3154576 RepID=UPI0033AE0387
MEFPELLRLIDERSTAFSAVVAAAPALDAQVPTCPGWTLLDLAHHLGDGRRKWASIVAAGPASAPPPPPVPAEPAPQDHSALLPWLAASTRQLLDALRSAGPDRGCWTWWADSESPQTSGAVARHQLQEVAVHTYDAQLTTGAPQPLPTAIALDGVDEFLATCCAGAYHWPHTPATLDYHATEGRSWRLSLTADAVRLTRSPAPTPADAALHATASDLVLTLYGRIPFDSLPLTGDRRHFDLLVAWDPDEEPLTA